MNIFNFSAAKAVFAPFPTSSENSVNQYGFYYALDLSPENETQEPFSDEMFSKCVTIRLAARNVYRLYVNGEIVMHGPSRTAHGYCRVDEMDISKHVIEGVNHIAIEVLEYGNSCSGYNRYSNDCTMEDGMFVAEIDVDGEIVSATGREAWNVCQLTERSPKSERISHSRESIEIYTLDDNYYLWRFGLGTYEDVILLENEPVYLPHNALKSTLEESPITTFIDVDASFVDEEKEISRFFFEQNSPFFDSLTEHPLDDCRKSVNNPDGSVQAKYEEDGLTFNPVSTDDYYALWDCDESRVGFTRIEITCEKSGIIDLVHVGFLDLDGSIPYKFNMVTRLHVQAGYTEFVTMEPSVMRYLAIYFRGTGITTVHKASVLEYSYPDERRASFLCNDENVNRLYKAAKKTLLLNTQDIFMDCPGRERGGWLCDSLWTARASALMLSDSRVEREHIENFLLTKSEDMFHGFFPEVYPAFKDSYKGMVGITTWSFWLMVQTCEYISRTGDISFRDKYKKRVADFVEGTKDFIGNSGLLENLPFVFIDWSASNYAEYQLPISTPVNALYAYMMENLGKTFGEPSWVEAGLEIRSILKNAITGGKSPENLTRIPDGFKINENGTLCGNDRYTEAAIYTSLWCDLFTVKEAPQLIKTVRDRMGNAPLYAKDPDVGASQLFIGLCIRLDMLSKFGFVDKMFEDLRATFEPQIKEGPDTFWEIESIHADSRCHGFGSHVGVHLMRDVLGLGFNTYEANGEGKRVIEISPHICGLRWAKGTRETAEGIISVSWKYDGESFKLKVTLPEALEYKVTLPKETRMLDKDKISVTVKKI